MVLATETTKTRAAVISVPDAGSAGELGTLSAFREAFYECLQRRADALFELTDSVLCTDGPVCMWAGCRWRWSIAVGMGRICGR
jgi:hypothetical protein